MHSREDYKWDEIYPELVNKIRWAICTTLGTPGSKYPFGVAQKIATVLSQDVIDLIKTSVVAPGVLGSTGTIRGHQAQIRSDSDPPAIDIPRAS